MFYIDFLLNGKRKRVPVPGSQSPTDAAEAQAQILTAQKTAVSAGIMSPTNGNGKNRSVKDAVSSYLTDILAHKKKKTHYAYSTSLTYFLESCPKQTLESIDQADLLKFKTYLKVTKEQSDRTCRNNFANVLGFLKAQKITGLVTVNDWPTYTQEEPETYTQEELNTFFSACEETELTWFKFFYFTGCREQEVMHVSWSDIDFERSVVTVRENKRFGFKPKAYKGREIPIPSELVSLLRTLKAKSDQTCGLVFPTSGCKPKLNFLDECKAIALRANLNPPDNFYLHKFRATRATEWLRGGIDIKSVQKMLGHSDMESTLRYLSAQRTDVLQAQIEKLNEK